MGSPQTWATYYDVEALLQYQLYDIQEIVYNSEDALYQNIIDARDAILDNSSYGLRVINENVLDSSRDIRKRLEAIAEGLGSGVGGISDIVADSEARIIRQVVDTENRLYDTGKQLESLIGYESDGIKAYVDKRAIETEQYISDEVDRILAKVTGLEETFEAAIEGLAQGIIGVVEALINSIGLMVSGVATAIGAIIEGVINLLIAAIDNLSSIFSQVGTIIANGIVDAIGYIGETIVTLTEWLGKTIGTLVEAVTTVLVDVGKALATAVEELAISLGNFINASAEVIANIGNAIADILQQLVTILRDMWEAGKEWAEAQEAGMAEMAGISTTGPDGRLKVGSIQELIAGILTTIINEYYKLARTSYDQFSTLGD